MEQSTWTVKEIADFLKVSQQMVYNLIKAQEFPSFKVGSSVRVLGIDFKNYIERQKSLFSAHSREAPVPKDGMVQLADFGVHQGSYRLSGINFEFPVGASLGVIGPSGSGKTLLLRSLAGLVDPDAGWFMVNGKSLLGLGPSARKIGFVFQEYSLYPKMTPHANIAFPQAVSHVTKLVQDTSVQRIAKRLGIDEEYLTRRVDALPEGIKQLVAIGRAENREAHLLVMDEPLVHLDAGVRRTMRTFLSALRQELGVTTIYAFNDAEDALALSDYLLVLMNGKQTVFGPRDAVYRNSPDRDTMQLLSIHGVNTVQIVHEGIPAQLVFRPEEIEMTNGPYRITIKKRTLLDGNTVMAQGVLDDGQAIRIAVPAETGETCTFNPTHPRIFPGTL